MRSKMADAWVNQQDGPHFGDLRQFGGIHGGVEFPIRLKPEAIYSLLRFLLWGVFSEFRTCKHRTAWQLRCHMKAEAIPPPGSLWPAGHLR